MKQLLNIFAILIITIISVKCNYQQNIHTIKATKYEPTWESLDKRPLPQWYDDAKIGIFIHWGVFSVPSFGSEWFWMSWKGRNQSAFVDYMNKYYREGFTYQEFAKEFTAEFFEPKKWANLFKKSGAKYIVLTSKHHEGYTLWPSKYSYSWNSVDVGPHRDLIDELSNAVRAEGLRFGLYHSLYEWFNPLYISDKESKFVNKEYVRGKALPELLDIVIKYKPEIVWSDGDWEAYDDYWESRSFLAWLYNLSPVKDTVVANDRWGIDIPCHHGDIYTCTDRFNPGVIQSHKWENAMTIDKESWGFRRNAPLSDYLTTHDLIKTLVETISCGGNILINVGPTKDGIIAPIFEERLLDLGSWLETNGEAIYESKPWTTQNDTQGGVWYTSKLNTVYAISLNWPEKNVLQLGSASELFLSSETTLTLLGTTEKLKWVSSNNIVSITFPDKATVKSNWVYIIKITNYK